PRLVTGPARPRGFAPDPDYTDGDPRGVGRVQVTQKNGRRWSTADAFLRPAAGRPNLTVLTGATALALDVDGDHGRGVTLAGAPIAVARARREVVLAAGAIGSPQLLM